MARVDEHLRKMQGKDPRRVDRKPTGQADGTNRVEVMRVSGKSKGSSAQSQVSRSTPGSSDKHIRQNAANSWEANQQRHMELRGATLFLMPRGVGDGLANSPIPPQDAYSPADANAFFITLANPSTEIAFDWSVFDDMAGSTRGNIRVMRQLFMQLIIDHKGNLITFADPIRWPDGVQPDLTPAPGGHHVLNFMALRFGTGQDAVTHIYGAPWGVNCSPDPEA